MGVINDILDFSRIEAGKLRIDPHPFVLDQVLAGVVDGQPQGQRAGTGTHL